MNRGEEEGKRERERERERGDLGKGSDDTQRH